MYGMRTKVNILLTCVISCSGLFFHDSLHKGSLTPSDPDVCIWQNITFTCTLLSPPIPSNSIGFAVKNESANKEFLPVDDGRFRVINETSSELTIYASATTDFCVKCFYWETFGDVDDESLQLGNTSTASLYPVPEKVEEINCIVENYITSMKCSWNYGEKYQGSAEPNVEFLWRIPEDSGSWNNCTELNIKEGYCYWKSSRHGDFTMKLIDIKLTLSEPCGIRVTSNFTIDTRKKVKPNPVIGLKYFVLNSTCIRVQWRTNNSEMQYPKEHRMIVSNEWDGPRNPLGEKARLLQKNIPDFVRLVVTVDLGRVYKFNTTKHTEKNTHIMTLCNLHPHTEYTFSVSIQPTGKQAGFYSDPRETEATTYSDIPSSSPSVTDGGYSWTPRDCEGTNAKRQVCVFWKPIREEDKNGQMKGLDGTFIAVQQTKTPIDVNWAEDLTYGCSAGLLCNTSYIFSIKARNSNGTSVESSKLLISAATLGIAQPQFIVEAANSSTVSVGWEETGEASGYMVAWCRNKNGECENRNKVYWQKFSSNRRKAVIQINPENSPQDFLYGVSVLTEQGSSGVEWQDCVYLHNAEPKREPQNVIVSQGSEDNTLVVTWDKLACKSDEPYIAMYNLQYNQVNDRNQKSIDVPASGEARVVLKDLEERQTYIVTVRGITKDGEPGPNSQPRKGVPVNKRLKPDEIVGIALCVLVVVLFAAVGCVCMIRKCKQTAKKNIKQLGDITIPENPNLRFDETAVRQNSNDSGYVAMTPSTEKIERPKFDPSVLNNRPRVTPDGYCLTTVGNGQSPDTGTHPLELVSLDTTLDKFAFIPTEPVVADVGFVMNESNRNSGETLVKTVDKDTVCNETAVKARTKNDYRDSGVSDACTKATLGRSKEKIHNDNCEDVDENNAKSNNDVPDYVSGDKVISSCAKDIYNKRDSENENVTPQIATGANNKIPKPLAFSECSDSDSCLSDLENDHVTETSVESSVDNRTLPNCNEAETSTIITNINSDYFQGQLPEHEIQNKRNEDNENKTDKVSTDISFPSITNIPRPICMDESDTTSIEEENASSPTHTQASSSPKVPPSGTNKNDYIEVANCGTHLTLPPSNLLNHVSQPLNKNKQISDYVPTTNMPTLSAKNSHQQLENSGTGYVTLPNTGTNVSGKHAAPDQLALLPGHQKQDRAYITVSESRTSKENADTPLGYVTSVTSPNVSHAIQSSPSSSQSSKNPGIKP